MPGCSSPPVTSASSRNRRRLAAVVGVMVLDLLERHLAIELGIHRHEDGAQAALGVRPEHAESLAVGGSGADGGAGRAVGLTVGLVAASIPGRGERG